MDGRDFKDLMRELRQVQRHIEAAAVAQIALVLLLRGDEPPEHSWSRAKTHYRDAYLKVNELP